MFSKALKSVESTDFNNSSKTNSGICFDFNLNKHYLSKIKYSIGFSNIEFALSIGRSIDTECISFFNCLGFCLYEIYGLSETCGLLTMNTIEKHKVYTVGVIIDGVEISKENDNIECKMKGRNLCIGYVNDENNEYKSKIDENGYFKTGDMIIIDNDDFVSIAGRNDDILITPVYIIYYIFIIIIYL